MLVLVDAPPPEGGGGDVIDLPLVGDVGRAALPAIKGGKLLGGKAPQGGGGLLCGLFYDILGLLPVFRLLYKAKAFNIGIGHGLDAAYLCHPRLRFKEVAEAALGPEGFFY